MRKVSLAATAACLMVMVTLLGACADDSTRRQNTTPSQSSAALCAPEDRGTWKELQPLVVPRAYACGVYYDGHVYIIGGVSNSDDPKTLEDDHLQFPQPREMVLRYDPRSTPTDIVGLFTDLPVPVAGAACVVHDNKVWVMGGYTGEQETHKNSNLFQVYDFKTDSWSQGPHMNEPRSWGAAVVVNDQVCMAGGAGHKKYSDSVECYRPGDSNWKVVGTISQGRYGLGGFVHDGKIFLSGGNWFDVANVDHNVDSIEEFDPLAGTSKIVGYLPEATSAIIGVTGMDGRGYLYIQGRIWDATDPTTYLLEIDQVPAMSPREFNYVYEGWSFPVVVPVPGGLLVAGGGSSAAPTRSVKLLCLN